MAVEAFQSVVPIWSRHGDMVKTSHPHARLKSEHAVARRGFDTALLIDHAQAKRVTVPGGEAARRRSIVEQKTLAGIDAREYAQLQEDIAYAEEMIHAASLLPSYSGDPDAIFPGVYPTSPPTLTRTLTATLTGMRICLSVMLSTA